jgi:hypothetical protein
MEVRFEEQLGARDIGLGIAFGGASVPKNRRIHPAVEAGVAQIGHAPDPVVVDLLVGLQYERVALGGAFWIWSNNLKIQERMAYKIWMESTTTGWVETPSASMTVSLWPSILRSPQ